MLTDFIKAVTLGIVEGLTEFLPISSTGHLILVNEWINFDPTFTNAFNVIIQLGAILAVVVLFFSRLWPFNKEGEEKKRVYDIWVKAVVAVVPALVLGFLLGDFIEQKLFNPWVVAIALIIGGLILIYIERKQNNFKFLSVSDFPFKMALFIGLIQCIAMIPGTSRAASTIIGAMLLGASRVAAVEFSFFLAIPTMIAASGYSLVKHGFEMSGSELMILAAGFVTAFIVSLTIIKFFIKYIQTHNFIPFGYYRIVLGVLVILYFSFV